MNKTQIHSFVLPDAAKAFLQKELAPIKYPATAYGSYLAQISAVRSKIAVALTDILPFLSEQVPPSARPAAIEITNLPVDANIDRPPSNGAKLKHIPKASYLSENLLVLFAGLFGTPCSMSFESESLVNNVIPLPSAKSDFSALSSSSDLSFHIENAALRFHDNGRDCAPMALFFTGVVRRGCLALADALHLRGVERIMLPATLTLLLRADLRSAAEREDEGVLEHSSTFDLAADIADDRTPPTGISSYAYG